MIRIDRFYVRGRFADVSKDSRDGLGESWGGKGGIGGRKVTPSDTRMRNGTAFRGGRRSEWANNFASLCS